MTGVLLDTNVVSALRRPDREPAVAAWQASVRETAAWVSALTLFEIDLGIARVRRRDPVFADELAQWRDGRVLPAFADRIIAVDQEIATAMAQIDAAGQTAETVDLAIGATALTRRLTLATRNVSDFEGMALEERAITLVNPWG